MAKRLGKPVTYLNDGNAAALWGHFALFGAKDPATSVSVIIGTGLGGGVITHGNVMKGLGGELGHVLLPYQRITATSGIELRCNVAAREIWNRFAPFTAIEKTLLPFSSETIPIMP